MKITYLSRVVLLLAIVFNTIIGLSSCNDEKDDLRKTVITNVAISSDTENALRYPVEITLNSDYEVSISYWPTNEPTKERMTKVVQSSGGKANLTIMFVKPETDYQFAVNTNSIRQKDVYDFRTAKLPAEVPTYKITVDNGGAPTKGYILQWQASKPGYYTFCDMDGNVVWYQQVEQAARNGFYNPDDRQLYVTTGYNRPFVPNKSDRFVDKVFSMDLFGNRDIELSAAEEPLKYSHHEFRILPDGNLILVRNYIKNYDLTDLGLGDNQEVYGDGYIVVDRKGKEIDRWDIFDECSPFNSHNVILEKGGVYDFVHCNCVNFDSEGYYYLSFNRLKQVWKVDPKTGKVLYRLGENGNVAIPEDAIPEGVHAVTPLAPDKFMVVDNGEIRGYSRTLVFDVNMSAMTAEVTTSIEYPNLYSSSNRSNSELLPDGKTVMFSSTEGRACVFTDLQGNILKIITRDGISYRGHYYEDIME